MPKMSWEEFCYEYIETGYFDYECRPKTLAAMKLFWKKCPERYLRRIPNVLVFAIGGVHGEVLPWRCGLPGQLIYLSECLERRSQSYVNRCVAHEFAHAILGHGTPEGMTKHSSRRPRHGPVGKSPAEVAADNLIKKWGYKASYACNR